MDEDLKELATILARNSLPKESSLTVKWAAVIGVLVLVCGFLFVGYGLNASNIAKLDARIEARNEYTLKAIAELKDSQLRMENIVNEIRMDQLRRERRER